jgi:hypothetical protein
MARYKEYAKRYDDDAVDRLLNVRLRNMKMLLRVMMVLKRIFVARTNQTLKSLKTVSVTSVMLKKLIRLLMGRFLTTIKA